MIATSTSPSNRPSEKPHPGDQQFASERLPSQNDMLSLIEEQRQSRFPSQNMPSLTREAPVERASVLPGAGIPTREEVKKAFGPAAEIQTLKTPIGQFGILTFGSTHVAEQAFPSTRGPVPLYWKREPSAQGSVEELVKKAVEQQPLTREMADALGLAAIVTTKNGSVRNLDSYVVKPNEEIEALKYLTTPNALPSFGYLYLVGTFSTDGITPDSDDDMVPLGKQRANEVCRTIVAVEDRIARLFKAYLLMDGEHLPQHTRFIRRRAL